MSSIPGAGDLWQLHALGQLHVDVHQVVQFYQWIVERTDAHPGRQSGWHLGGRKNLCLADPAPLTHVIPRATRKLTNAFGAFRVAAEHSAPAVRTRAGVSSQLAPYP